MKGINGKSTSAKTTEKVFAQSLAVSVFSLLLCMVALCSVTWAWFSASVSSGTNNIQSAYCDVTVSVKNNDTPADLTDGKYVLLKDKTYTITLTATGNAQNAYCILNIKDTSYYTQHIPLQSGDKTMTFTLKFSADTPVEIITRWGTSGQGEGDFQDGLYYVDLAETDLPVTTQAQGTTETGALPEATQ